MLDSMSYLKDSAEGKNQPRLVLIGDIQLEYIPAYSDVGAVEEVLTTTELVSVGGYLLDERQVGQLINWLSRAHKYMINQRQKEE